MSGFLALNVMLFDLGVDSIVEGAPVIVTQPVDFYTTSGQGFGYYILVEPNLDSPPTFRWEHMPASGGAWVLHDTNDSNTAQVDDNVSSILIVTDSMGLADDTLHRCIVTNANASVISVSANLSMHTHVSLRHYIPERLDANGTGSTSSWSDEDNRGIVYATPQPMEVYKKAEDSPFALYDVARTNGINTFTPSTPALTGANVQLHIMAKWGAEAVEGYLFDGTYPIGRVYCRVSDDGSAMVGKGDGNDEIEISGWMDTQWHLITIDVDDSTVNVYVDGSLEGGFVDGSANKDTWSNITMFSKWDGTSVAPANTQIAEVLVHSQGQADLSTTMAELLAKYAPVKVPATIDAQPQSFTATEGDSAVIAFTANHPTAPITYAWTHDFADATEDGSTLTLNTTAVSDNGKTAFCTVSANQTWIVTDTITAVVEAIPVAPVITTQLVHRTMIEPSGGIFSIAATHVNDEPITYEWFHSFNDATANGNVLTLHSTEFAEHDRTVYVNVIADGFTVKSTVRKLTVVEDVGEAALPRIDVQPEALVDVVAPAGFELSVEATAFTGTPRYKWQYAADGISFAGFANNTSYAGSDSERTLTVPTTMLSDKGFIRCRIRDGRNNNTYATYTRTVTYSVHDAPAWYMPNLTGSINVAFRLPTPWVSGSVLGGGAKFKYLHKSHLGGWNTGFGHKGGGTGACYFATNNGKFSKRNESNVKIDGVDYVADTPMTIGQTYEVEIWSNPGDAFQFSFIGCPDDYQDEGAHVEVWDIELSDYDDPSNDCIYPVRIRGHSADIPTDRVIPCSLNENDELVATAQVPVNWVVATDQR